MQLENYSNCEFISVSAQAFSIIYVHSEMDESRRMFVYGQHSTSYLYRAGVNTRKSAECRSKVNHILTFDPAIGGADSGIYSC
jgi:hypothetical protein